MSLPSVQNRLTSTSSLLLERSRVLSLSLKPSPSSTAQIVRNLTSLRSDLAKIEDELRLESGGLVVGRGTSGLGSGIGSGSGSGGKGKYREKEGELAEAVGQYDRLVEMLAQDEMGRERAESLRREKDSDRMGIGSSPVLSPLHSPLTSHPSSASPLPSPSHFSHPLHPSPSSRDSPVPPVKPFRDSPSPPPPRKELSSPTAYPRTTAENGYDDSEDYDDDEDRSPHQLLSEQQDLIDDQDERLNVLSHSIGMQNHLSLQIGSELDLHHQLLEDTDVAMDRTASRLGKARKRLDRVAGEARQYGSTITIVALIFVLLILIIVFKT